MSSSITARRLYDWDDYQRWPSQPRLEIIAGEAYDMTPAPAPRHQRVLKRLCGLFDRYLEGN
jgi:hypothetical protein